jgi:hypothetical protein
MRRVSDGTSVSKTHHGGPACRVDHGFRCVQPIQANFASLISHLTENGSA